MHYSFSKRNSRLLSLLLVLTMVATLFSGCFGSKTPEETNPSEDSNVPPGLVDVKPTEAPTEPAETEPALSENSAIVNADQLSVRSAPGINSPVIGTLEKGEVVEVIDTRTSLGIQWARISKGWVPAEYLQFNFDPDFGNDEPAGTTDPSEPQTQGGSTATMKGVITASELYIRKEAGAGNKTIGSYIKGDVVTILETKKVGNDTWGRTNQGWISMQYVKTEGEPTNDNNQTENKDNNKNDVTTGTGTATNIKGVVTASELNIRKDIEGDRVGGYVYGDRITILETKNGWGRTDKGWVSLTYVYQDGTQGKNTAKGIITGNQLNVRGGPGTGYDRVGSMNYGDRVNILEQITIGDTTWACTKNGWISMEFVYVDGTKGETSGVGIVTGDQVNLRSGPGTGYESKGSVNSGDTVEILEIFKIGDKSWGCTKNGWICMDYVSMG